MLEKLQALGTYRLGTPLEYINKYVGEFSLVDTYYRRVVDTFTEIDPIIPVYDCLMSFKRHLDEEYSKQCNLFNLEWLRCVSESGVSLS